MGADGLPLGNVEITCTQLDAAWLPRIGAWPDLDWDAIERRTVRAFSTADGIAEVVDADRRITSGLIAVWITHPSILTRRFILKDGEVLPSTVDLERAPSIDAEVVDQNGVAISGATIVQYDDVYGANRSLLSNEEYLALATFRRSITSDAEGRARLAPAERIQHIEAITANARSNWWRGRQPAVARLELLSTFTARGRVIEPVGYELSPSASVIVRTKGPTGVNGYRKFFVDTDGGFGPFDVPVLDVESYYFLVDDGRLLPEPEVVPKPRANELVEVEIKPDIGVNIDYHVTDLEYKDLPNATATIQWVHNGVHSSVRRRTDEKGMCSFLAIRPGLITLFTQCDGYVSRTDGPITHPDAPRQPYLITLAKAGTLRGRVAHRGKPVERFEIYYCSTDSPATVQVHRVEYSQDGTFEMGEIQRGSVSLFASAEGLPRSQIEVIEVADEPAVVELEIRDGRKGKGRVVDSRSYEPVVGASVKLYYGVAGLRTIASGLPSLTNAAGEFEVEGVVSGESAIEFLTTQYGERSDAVTVLPSSLAAEVVDLGLFALDAPASVVAHARVDPADASNWQVNVSCSNAVAPQPLPQSGVVRFDCLPIEALTVSFLRSDGDYVDATVVPKAGHTSRIDVDLVSVRPLRVKLKNAPVLGPDHYLFVTATCADAGGRTSVFRREVDKSSLEADLSRVPADRFVLNASTTAGEFLAMMTVDLKEQPTEMVVMDIGQDETIVRVVDANRKPLPNVSVWLSSREWTGLIRGGLTDAKGEMRARNMPNSRFDVLLRRTDLGGAAYPSTEFRPGEATELRLEVDGGLALTLVDRGEPVPGARAAVGIDGYPTWYVVEGRSDVHGFVKLGGVPVKEHLVEVGGAGLWPVERRLRAHVPARTENLEVRRTGSVSLHTTSLGNAAGKRALDISNVETGESVTAWLESGRISSSTNSLVTDEAGTLRLDGLPRGAYAWSHNKSDETVVSGTFEVPPRAMGTATLALD